MTFSLVHKSQSSREHKLIKSTLKIPGCMHDVALHPYKWKCTPKITMHRIRTAQQKQQKIIEYRVHHHWSIFSQQLSHRV